MKRYRAILLLAICAGLGIGLNGCPTRGGGLEPFPIPISYDLTFTTEGVIAHTLSLTEPVNETNHPFEVVVAPVSPEAVGSISFHSGRTASSSVSLDGLTIGASVFRSGTASTAYFRGVTGYENSGVVVAIQGELSVTLSDDLATCSGSIHLVTNDPLVTASRRTFDAEFTGTRVVPTGGGGGGGGAGGVTPPRPPI